MDLKFYELSWKGPVRPRNEDAVGSRRPAAGDADGWRERGAVFLLCDGVGGQGNGDRASRVAVAEALNVYATVAPGTTPGVVLQQMFSAANLAVYDAGTQLLADDPDGAETAGRRMATTMTALLLRSDQLHVGHVGDCRAYHIRGREVTRLTVDHSYSGVQQKLGLISDDEAAASPLRYVLTRSMGRDPTVRVDYRTVSIMPGDFVVQCCDGVHSCVNEQELTDIVTRWPEMACQELMALCERRGADDNLSVQIIHILSVERLSYYRGLPIYQPVQDAHMDQDLQPEQVLDGRYRIAERISKSGMASIYRATDLTDGSEVALKVPYMQFESDPTFFSRFQREQEIAQRLNHPSIIRWHADQGVEHSRPYLVMEFLRGQTLGQLMRGLKPMPEADAARIISRVCDAVQYMHDNDVVHRDLKPENIMICDDGSIRLMDFGIAKVAGARRLTFGKFQPAMGTPDFMSPEQVRGARGDGRTDIYSLGAILYEMVTGKPPFEGNNPLTIMNARLSGDPLPPRRHNPAVSAAMEEIILHAMARNPDDRYQTAGAMRHDLDYPAEVEVTGRAERVVPVRPIRVNARRLAMLWVAIGVVVIFLIALLLSHLHIHVEVH
jgi:serine/threonine protein phosphatase PrpC